MLICGEEVFDGVNTGRDKFREHLNPGVVLLRATLEFNLSRTQIIRYEHLLLRAKAPKGVSGGGGLHRGGGVHYPDRVGRFSSLGSSELEFAAHDRIDPGRLSHRANFCLGV